jgi:hypothetical protein
VYAQAKSTDVTRALVASDFRPPFGFLIVRLDDRTNLTDPDKSNLKIEGHAGPSGFGFCQVVVPLTEASDYQITVESFGGLPIPEEIQKVGYVER